MPRRLLWKPHQFFACCGYVRRKGLIISGANDCLSGSLTCRTSYVCTRSTDCPFKITTYKFVPRIPLLLSLNTPPSPMGPPVKAWNETRNRPDDDDPTSHSLLLTSSLDKTGGRSVADESKTLNTGSSPSNNTSSDNNNTKFYTSTNIDVNAPIRNNHDDFTSFLPPSIEAACR